MERPACTLGLVRAFKVSSADYGVHVLVPRLALAHVPVAPYGRPGSLLDDVLEAQGRRRRIALTVRHFLAAFMVVAESDFVLTASERLARYFQEILPIKVLVPPLPLEPYAIVQVWHERTHAEPAHRWRRQRCGRSHSAAQSALSEK